MHQFTVFAVGPAGGNNRALGMAPLETFANYDLAYQWLSEQTNQFVKPLCWKGAIYDRVIIVHDFLLGPSNANNPFNLFTQ